MFEYIKMAVLLFLFTWTGCAFGTLFLVILFLYFWDRKRFAKKWEWTIPFALYMVLLCITVGLPSVNDFKWYVGIDWETVWDFTHIDGKKMMFHMLMFLPFGTLVPIYFEKFRNWKSTVLAGFLLSFFMEVSHLFSILETNVLSILFNPLAVLLGYWIVKPFLRKKVSIEENDREGIKLFLLVAICIVAFWILEHGIMAISMATVFRAWR